jgi:Zn-dependent peptidase ImmA (M78 family)
VPRCPPEIERHLSDDRYEVLGYTQFEPGKKPCVKIATELWQKWYQANRLRFTLAHEFGHILLHRWLYDKYPPAGGSQLCYRHNLLPSDLVLDWMEWQAGYAAGALLMPESFVRRAVVAFFSDRAKTLPLRKDAITASTLSQRIALTFEVSPEAANVRLAKLGYLID